MRLRLLLLTACALGAAGAGASPAAASLKLTPCKKQKGFGCTTITVPLDRSGAVPGTIRLKVAVEDTKAARRKPGWLMALSGGPGQGAVDYATSFQAGLKPALKRYRLVLLDTRGTGGSGVLRCAGVQKLGDLAPVDPALVADCARTVGPAFAHYSTRDTVEDIDAVRAALGAKKLALMGISYGTFVAQQYARIHPDTTDRLILDSVIAGDGIDPFFLDSVRALPRVLKEQCRKRACTGITKDPLADLTTLLAKLPVSAPAYDDKGRRRTASYPAGDEILGLLLAGDLNPYLQAALPGAIHAAAKGDPALLARLRRIADGGAVTAKELSAGLNVATTCLDGALPYGLDSATDSREAASQAAVDALDPARYAPFPASSVLRGSLARQCEGFPPTSGVVPPSNDPLPDVPTLLLSGRLDLRTPLENAKDLAAGVPQAVRVTVPGNGHDELDTDISGCVAVALRRFTAGTGVGQPCAGKDDAVPPLPVPPRKLKEFERAPGVPGDRGRVVFAVLDTVGDAQINGYQRLFADLPRRGGGLRGGSYAFRKGTLRLSRYAYLPGLRLTGRLGLFGGNGVGTVRVSGLERGTLRLHPDGSVSGRLDGRRVSYTPVISIRLARAGAVRPRLAAVAARIARRGIGHPPRLDRLG